jgi:hypothetical protein
MNPTELRDSLADLARDVGIDVRVATGRPETEPGMPVQSGVCRVRDAVWVILAGGDPVEEHIAVLAQALREHAGDALESRFLPPAVRERLDRAP